MVLTWRAMVRSAPPLGDQRRAGIPPVNRTAVMSRCSCDGSAEQPDAAAGAEFAADLLGHRGRASSARPSRSSLSNPAGTENNSTIAADDAQPAMS